MISMCKNSTLKSYSNKFLSCKPIKILISRILPWRPNISCPSCLQIKLKNSPCWLSSAVLFWKWKQIKALNVYKWKWKNVWNRNYMLHEVFGILVFKEDSGISFCFALRVVFLLALFSLKTPSLKCCWDTQRGPVRTVIKSSSYQEQTLVKVSFYGAVLQWTVGENGTGLTL